MSPRPGPGATAAACLPLRPLDADWSFFSSPGSAACRRHCGVSLPLYYTSRFHIIVNVLSPPLTFERHRSTHMHVFNRHCFLSHTLLIGGLPGPKKKGEGPREEAAAATPRWLEVEAKAPCARVSCSAHSGPSHTAGSGIGASLLRPLPIGTAGPLGSPDEG